MQRGQIIQALDNVTWTRQTLLQIRRGLQAHHRPRRQRLRQLSLRLVCLQRLLGRGRRPSATLTPHSCSAIPDYTEVSPPTTHHERARLLLRRFAQDDWKITPSLTLNLGLRYELHPPLRETHYNTAVFSPITAPPSAARRSVAPSWCPTRRPSPSSPRSLPAPSRPRPSSPPRRPAFPTPALHRQDRLGSAPRLCLAASSATTRPFCAAAGDASLKLRSAFRWSPAGPSIQLCGHLQPGLRLRRSHAAALLRQSLQHSPPAAPPEPPASTTPFPSTTKTPTCSSGT
jgi:hypothetical protein